MNPVIKQICVPEHEDVFSAQTILMLILLDANERPLRSLRALAFYLFNLGRIPATDTETETPTLSIGRASSSVRSR